MFASAVGYFNKASVAVGFVPKSDVSAQEICFEYLEKSVALLQERIKEEQNSHSDDPPTPGVPQESLEGLLKNQLVVLKDTAKLIEPSKGSYEIKKAKTFWGYWDKVKRQAVLVVEGRETNHESVTKELEKLEAGRYELI